MDTNKGFKFEKLISTGIQSPNLRASCFQLPANKKYHDTSY